MREHEAFYVVEVGQICQPSGVGQPVPDLKREGRFWFTMKIQVRNVLLAQRDDLPRILSRPRVDDKHREETCSHSRNADAYPTVEDGGYLHTGCPYSLMRVHQGQRLERHDVATNDEEDGDHTVSSVP